MASALDAMAMRMWQASGGNGPKPRPIPRPGVGTSQRRMGSTSLSPERARQVLDRIGIQPN